MKVELNSMCWTWGQDAARGCGFSLAVSLETQYRWSVSNVNIKIFSAQGKSQRLLLICLAI